MDSNPGVLIRLHRLAAALAAFALVGLSMTACTVPTQLPTLTDRQRQDYLVNQAMIDDQAGEAIQNQLSLINIVRATLNRPRYYVDMTSWLQGVPQGGASTERDWIFGADPIKAKGTLSLQTPTSSATITPLTAQKFVTGITKPMTVDELNYLIQEGYPTSLLLHLFVKSVSVYPDDSHQVPTHIYNNDPMSADYATADAVLNGLSACYISVVDAMTGAPAVANARKDSQDSAAHSGAGKKDNAGTQADVTSSLSFRVWPDEKAQGQGENPNTDRNEECNATFKMMDIATSAAGSDPSKPAWKRLKLQIRSPEAIVYYLGEITREQLDGPYGANGLPDPGARYPVGTVSYDGCTTEEVDQCIRCVSIFDVIRDAKPLSSDHYYSRHACQFPTTPKSDKEVPKPTGICELEVTEPDFKKLYADALTVSYEDVDYSMSWDFIDRTSYTLLSFSISELVIGMQTDASELQNTNIIKTAQ